MSAIDFGSHISEAPVRAPLVRRIDPRVRLVLSAAFAATTISLTHPLALVASLSLAGICALLARLDPGVTLKRMASLDGFMIFVVGFLPFTSPGTPLLSIAGFDLSQAGLMRAATLLLASNAVVLMVLALVGTMEEAELGIGMAGLHAPSKLTHLFLLTTRYIDVLRREYRRLRVSMKVRGFRMGCNMHTWRTIGYLFGMLLVRSLERAERIMIAMRCRGFRGELHMLQQPARPRSMDHLFGGSLVLIMAVILVLDHL